YGIPTEGGAQPSDGGGAQVTYYADSGHVIKKTVWNGDESSASYEDTGVQTSAPDGTGANSPSDLGGYGQAGTVSQQPTATQPTQRQPTAAGRPGTVTQAVSPGYTNPTAAQGARGPFSSQSAAGWNILTDANGNVVGYRPQYDPTQANTEGG